MNPEETVVAVEEAKPKRVRKPVVKVQKTGSQIVDEINLAHIELKEMEAAIDEIAPNSILRAVAQEVIDAKRVEFEKLTTTLYTV